MSAEQTPDIETAIIEFLLARIAEDVAAWTEHRTLREAEAKRRIIADAQWAYDHGFMPNWQTLRHLAAVYADHPEYDESSWWTGHEEPAEFVPDETHRPYRDGER